MLRISEQIYQHFGISFLEQVHEPGHEFSHASPVEIHGSDIAHW